MRIKLGALAVYIVMMGFVATPAHATQALICEECYFTTGDCPTHGGEIDCSGNEAFVFAYCDNGGGVYQTVLGDGGMLDASACENWGTGNFYELDCECTD